jgi:hypothetical protein
MIARFPLTGLAPFHPTRPACWRRRVIFAASMTLLTR